MDFEEAIRCYNVVEGVGLGSLLGFVCSVHLSRENRNQNNRVIGVPGKSAQAYLENNVCAPGTTLLDIRAIYC